MYKSITIKPFGYIVFILVIAVSIGLLATPYYYLAVVPGLIIPILLLFGKNPQYGYYLIVFMIPFQNYTSLSMFSELFSFPRFVGFWLIIVILFQYLIFKKSLSGLQSNLWPWLLALLVIGGFSALMSEYAYTSFNNLRILLFTYIFFAMTLFFVSYEGFLKIFPIVVIISTSICAFLSNIGYVFDISFFAMDLGAEEFKRATGMAGDPNEFCSILIFGIPFLIWLFFKTPGLFVKGLVFLLFCVSMVAIMLTQSRGGALTLVIVLGLNFVIYIRRLRPIYIGIIGVGLIFIIVASLTFIPSSYWERQKSVTQVDEDSSLSGRRAFYYAGWDAFKENPVMGKGPGTFPDYFKTTSYHSEYTRKGFESMAAHNTYLEFLVGQGIIGLILFVIVIVVSLKNFITAINNFRKSEHKELTFLACAYTISFISFLITFCLLSYVHIKFFWASLALSQIALMISKKTPEDRLLPKV